MWLPETLSSWVRFSSSLLSLLVTSLTLLVGACAVVVRRSPWLRNRALTHPIRRAEKRSSNGSDRLARSISAFLCERASAVGTEPSIDNRERLLPDLLRYLQASQGIESAHWKDVAKVALQVVRDATRPTNRSWYWDHIVSEESARVQKLLNDLGEALTPFSELQPVDKAKAGYLHDADSFASFVTAYTGCLVLADAAVSRSRCADSVMLWHSSRFLGPSGNDLSFAKTHASDPGPHACGYIPTPGDYDSLVVSTRGACLATLAQRDGLLFVLETEESCYGTSEGATKDGGFIKGANRACKHLTSQIEQSDPTVVPFAVDPASRGLRLKSRSRTTPHRVLNLTGQLAVITSDRYLMLARRSDSVDQSKNLFTASAGGLIEPLDDIDEHGIPDLLGGTLREAREEIGVSLANEGCKPAAVYQMNVARPGTDPTGQLVTAVLYFGHSKFSRAQMEEARRTDSDHARGAYETQAFEALPIDELATVADWLNSSADQCDGHAIMAILYSCLIVHKRDKVIAALTERVQLPRWYPGPGADGAQGSRLARNPWHTSEGLRLPERMPETWKVAWDRHLTLNKPAPVDSAAGGTETARRG